MEEITFKSITPIFNFEFSGTAEFFYSGTSEDCRYSIILKKYPLDGLLSGAPLTEQTKNINWSDYLHDITEYFLVIEATHPIDERLINGRTLYVGWTQQLQRVFLSVLRSLRLHCSKGFISSKTYIFNNRRQGLSTSPSFLNQNLFPHFGMGNSILDSSDFNSVIKIFDNLINKTFDVNNTLDKLVSLALEYHKIIFDLEIPEHGFLILMVIFESLFKKENEKNAEQASKRISRLISTTESDQDAIYKDFFLNKDPKSFCKIRNFIAHGDPLLNRKDVELRFLALHKNISKAIISLLSIPVGEIDHNKDFYDELSKFIDKRFSVLPNT